jgi:uncharacterized membrane protein YhhN
VSTPAAVVFAVFAVLAVADWIAVGMRNKPLEYVCKPGALAALAAVPPLFDPASRAGHVEVACFTAALVCSLAGDVFLMLESDRFVAGLAAFLAAHAFYIVGLNTTGLDALWPVPVVAAVGGGLAVSVGRRIVEGAKGKERVPVIVYMAVISLMVLSAWLAPWRSGVPIGAALAAATGATLFFVSDTMIGWDRFVGPLRARRLGVIVTYHLGQAGLVLSLLR